MTDPTQEQKVLVATVEVADPMTFSAGTKWVDIEQWREIDAAELEGRIVRRFFAVSKRAESE